MAVKKPLCNYTGKVKELAAGDTLAGVTVTLTTVEKDLGSVPVTSGTFDITGLSGLTANNPILISQATGPYTNKGDRQDEAEMDALVATAYVVNSTTIRAYWNSGYSYVAGNFKFNYAT